MQFPYLNLIGLNDPSKIDGILFHEEDYEGERGPFTIHNEKIEDEVCKELKVPDLSVRFLQYGWYGEGDNLPWSRYAITSFNPKVTSIIIPQSGELIKIKGENRKIVLTFPAMYDGRQPLYHILCRDKKQLENIRVLNQPERSFFGLEKVFTQEGFESLPRLTETKGLGLFIKSTDLVIVPSTCLSYF